MSSFQKKWQACVAKDAAATLAAAKALEAVDLLRLIKESCDINVADPSGKTALMFCVEHHSAQCIETVVNDAGADIEAENNQGETALFYAVRRGRQDLVLYLLEQGADLRHKNNAGYNPLEVADFTATQFGNGPQEKIYDLLLSFMHGKYHSCPTPEDRLRLAQRRKKIAAARSAARQDRLMGFDTGTKTPVQPLPRLRYRPQR